MKKKSRNNNITKIKRRFTWMLIIQVCAILMIMAPLQGSAQMFSIDTKEKKQQRTSGNYTMAGLSLEWADFQYRGNPNEPGGRADFTNPVVRLRFESPGIRLSTAFGGSLTGMKETAFTNINAQIENGISLYRGSSNTWILPIHLITDLMAVRPDGQSYEFQQSSVIFGTGLRWQIRFSGGGLMVFDAAPNYGFSFSQGSLFGGSLFRATGGAKLFVPVGSEGRAIAIAYHADYRTYDIERELNDYRYTSHAVTIGIGF